MYNILLMEIKFPKDNNKFICKKHPKLVNSANEPSIEIFTSLPAAGGSCVKNVSTIPSMIVITYVHGW